jgi:RNA polymerase sigma-70 factor (ECF subfamily)
MRLEKTEELALHLRLLAGDPLAPLETIESWLPELEKHLGLRYPTVASADDHFITTAAIDALLDYTTHPERYNPERSSLGSYLRMAATGDLINALRSDRTQRREATSIHPVENLLRARNSDIEAVIENVDASAVMQKVLEAFPEPIDRGMLSLILQGERSTGPYARLLGIEHLPVSEQRAAVKRHKDRIAKRLERLRESPNG